MFAPCVRLVTPRGPDIVSSCFPKTMLRRLVCSFFPHEEEAWKRFDFELGVLEMRVYAGGGADCELGEDGWGFVGEVGVVNGESEGGFAVEDIFCFWRRHVDSGGGLRWRRCGCWIGVGSGRLVG